MYTLHRERIESTSNDDTRKDLTKLVPMSGEDFSDFGLVQLQCTINWENF